MLDFSIRASVPISQPLLVPARIAVGSLNPVKINAVRSVALHWTAEVEIVPIAVASGVPDQPWGDDETIRGAIQRARAAREAVGADVGVGIEGGVVQSPSGQLRTCAWAAVAYADDQVEVGGSLSMPLPQVVGDLVRAGTELGHAIDHVAQLSNTKHGAGAVGILTANLVDRQQAYETIVAYAFAPLLSPSFWSRELATTRSERSQ